MENTWLQYNFWLQVVRRPLYHQYANAHEYMHIDLAPGTLGALGDRDTTQTCGVRRSSSAADAEGEFGPCVLLVEDDLLVALSLVPVLVLESLFLLEHLALILHQL